MAVLSRAASPHTRASAQAYQLYVELEWVRPKVWQGGHIHEFVFGRDTCGPKKPGLDLDHVMDEVRVTLGEALGEKKTFVYMYGYGDDWRHKVKVEKIVTLDAPIASGVCIGGENACPPEDVGDAPGYEEFLAALADPNDPQHGELKDWIGGSFDPTAFDVAEVNERLTASEY